MAHRRLSADTLLAIELSAICSRNRYTTDPAPVLEELLATAGDRSDILALEVGSWIGFHEDDEYRASLIAALRSLSLQLEEAIEVGRARRQVRPHSTEGHTRRGPYGAERTK